MNRAVRLARITVLLLGFLMAGCQPDAPIQVAGQAAELSIVPVSEHTLRITVEPVGDVANVVPIADGRVLATSDFGEPLLRVSELRRTRTLTHGTLRIRVSPSPLTIDVATVDGNSVQRFVIGEEDGSVAFSLGDGPVLGLGNGGQYFDRRGSFFTMQRGHRYGEYLVYGARTPIPFLIGTAGWSLFFHRPYNGRFDLRAEPGRFVPSESGGYFPQAGELVPSADREATKEAPLPLDFFVSHVDSPPRALYEYTKVTGKPAMPPKWALGYMQSHRNLSVGGPEEILHVARTFREKNLPIDALIYLGTGFTASGWNTGHGEFMFHPATFDQPQAMLDELNELNYNVVLHLTQPPAGLHGNIPPAEGEITGLDHVADYWDEHRDVFAMGVAGWWPDMGDPLDNDARLNRHYLYHAGPLTDRPNERPWSLHRTGFAGMHRFGGWIWSGDVNGAWKTLAAHIPVAINASLSTSPFWGSDIGGFYPTEEYTGELFVRWFQFGTFVPSFRAHGVTWRSRVPWGWSPGEMGPVHVAAYLRTGSLAADTLDLEYETLDLHTTQVEPVIKQYLELRYQLMPYLYSAVREAHDSGMPVIRALWLHYPDDLKAVAQSHQYLWGRDLLIAPVIEKGVQAPHYFSAREIYLPEGEWYDFWRPNQRVAGRQSITRTVDLATMPIFVRAGTILPMDPVRQHVYEPVDEPMTLRVYPGADGEFVLYDDDGLSMAFLEGEASWTTLRWDDAQRTLTIEPADGAPVDRSFRVVLVNEREDRMVEYRGDRVQVRFN